MCFRRGHYYFTAVEDEIKDNIKVREGHEYAIKRKERRERKKDEIEKPLL